MNEEATYTTIQGDTWDLISWKIYGDEKYMHYLIQYNIEYAEVLVFSAGTVLDIPDLPEEPDEDLPFWREDDLEDDDDDDDDDEDEEGE